MVLAAINQEQNNLHSIQDITYNEDDNLNDSTHSAKIIQKMDDIFPVLVVMFDGLFKDRNCYQWPEFYLDLLKLSEVDEKIISEEYEKFLTCSREWVSDENTRMKLSDQLQTLKSYTLWMKSIISSVSLTVNLPKLILEKIFLELLFLSTDSHRTMYRELKNLAKNFKELLLSFSTDLLNPINKILISEEYAQEGSAFTEHVFKLKNKKTKLMSSEYENVTFFDRKRSSSFREKMSRNHLLYRPNKYAKNLCQNGVNNISLFEMYSETSTQYLQNLNELKQCQKDLKKISEVLNKIEDQQNSISSESFFKFDMFKSSYFDDRLVVLLALCESEFSQIEQLQAQIEGYRRGAWSTYAIFSNENDQKPLVNPIKIPLNINMKNIKSIDTMRNIFIKSIKQPIYVFEIDNLLLPGNNMNLPKASIHHNKTESTNTSSSNDLDLKSVGSPIVYNIYLINFLNNLQGFKFIISNKPKKKIDKIIKELGITNNIDITLSSDSDECSSNNLTVKDFLKIFKGEKNVVLTNSANLREFCSHNQINCRLIEESEDNYGVVKSLKNAIADFENESENK
ncbi:hypothetical protein M153_13700017587 [Pseudoloma neurophilia]|uniref:Uncharacterized protein n=1 Tax=Pseudoloma neurophilia TaxID=146866 RepID=A0A0R0LZS5_9MICR|nr:hypothetical protein M153_13700017587 [Pseudoloma neurophilia]